MLRIEITAEWNVRKARSNPPGGRPFNIKLGKLERGIIDKPSSKV